jgi:xylan 1,4-beta-xylosidase
LNIPWKILLYFPNYILGSSLTERDDADHLKPKYYNQNSILQKSGHGSYVNLPNGEVYLVHLCSRPFAPELRCTLGRETAIEKMRWTEDNWLRMADGGIMAQMEVPEPNLPEVFLPKTPEFDDFDSGVLGKFYYAPRISPQSFADVTARPGYVRIRGQESRTSLNKVSILARKLTSVHCQITTKMDFEPLVYQHSAGLIIYYDNMNYINLRKYYSASLQHSAIGIIQLENGERTEYLDTKVKVEDKPIFFRLKIEGRKLYFMWSYDNKDYVRIGKEFDTTKFSDEYCKYGEFTGTMVGLTCADHLFHKHYADFDFFEYLADEDAQVE